VLQLVIHPRGEPAVVLPALPEELDASRRVEFRNNQRDDPIDITAGQRHDDVPRLSVIGGGLCLDEAAEAAGTISYELLTGLGNRYARHYVGGA
jgi:hypothetical protein